MDLKNINTFMYVAEQASFTKASMLLGYSQSTVSFQIKQLEEEFGFPLFERINHTIVLTEKGREVLNYAHAVSRMTAELKASTGEADELTGHIRLAMADSICHSLLAENFCKFTERYPGLTMKIFAADTVEMIRMLNHNEVDAIFTLDSHIYNSEYVTAFESRSNTSFIVSPDHPFAGRDNVELDELIRQPFILTEKGMSYRRILDEQLAEKSLRVEPILEIGDTGLICRLVSLNKGISFLPDFVTEKYVQDGTLCRIRSSELDAQIWIQLLYHRDKWLSPQLSAVLDYCSDMPFR